MLIDLSRGQLAQQPSQPLFYGTLRGIDSTQGCQNGREDDALLGMPYIFRDLGQIQPVLYQAGHFALLNRTGRLGD